MKRFRFVLLLCVVIFLIVHTQAELLSGKPYVLVVKDVTNPYMIRMYEGFKNACEELGSEPILKGPEMNGKPTQSAIVKELIKREVGAIIIAANDRETISAGLSEAMRLHIPVVSLDSAVNPDNRAVHIQQALPKTIGSVLIQAAAKIMGYKGEFAILSTTAGMPNQASWVKWMRIELQSYREKYKDMKMVEIAYGLDEYDASVRTAKSLLEKYPELKLIIAPTVVGLHAAAEVIRQSGLPAKVIGLGLPSNMEPYIMDGTCPWMYLWNPSDLGYLAAYAADAAATGRNIGAIGEILNAGMLGDRIVSESEDGGTEIVLGNPKMFDSTNVIVWKDLF